MPLYDFLKNNLFLVVLCLHCCVWAFSSCGEQGLLFLAVHGLLTNGFSCCGTESRHTGLQQLQHKGSVVAALGFWSSVVVAQGL